MCTSEMGPLYNGDTCMLVSLHNGPWEMWLQFQMFYFQTVILVTEIEKIAYKIVLMWI